MSRRCDWCAVGLSLRSRLRLCGMCSDCHQRGCREAGIYLQAGGPAWPRWYRDGESEPRAWFNKTINRGFN